MLPLGDYSLPIAQVAPRTAANKTKVDDGFDGHRTAAVLYRLLECVTAFVHVIGHGILAGTYLAKYRDSLE